MRGFVSPELYQNVFATNPTGQKVLEDLSAHFYDIQSYTKNDPYHTAYLEGQRAVIRHILSKLAYLPTEEIDDE